MLDIVRPRVGMCIAVILDRDLLCGVRHVEASEKPPVIVEHVDVQLGFGQPRHHQVVAHERFTG